MRWVSCWTQLSSISPFLTGHYKWTRTVFKSVMEPYLLLLSEPFIFIDDVSLTYILLLYSQCIAARTFVWSFRQLLSFFYQDTMAYPLKFIVLYTAAFLVSLSLPYTFWTIINSTLWTSSSVCVQSCENFNQRYVRGKLSKGKRIKKIADDGRWYKWW